MRTRSKIVQVLMPAVLLGLFCLPAAAEDATPEGEAPPKTEAQLLRMFELGAGLQRNPEMAKQAIMEMRKLYPEAGGLPSMELRMGEWLHDSYSDNNFELLDGPTGALSAMDHLSQFMPGGPFESHERAPAARMLHAKCLFIERRYAEAGDLFLELEQSPKIGITTEAFRHLYLFSAEFGVGAEELQKLEERQRELIAKAALPANKFSVRFMQTISDSRNEEIGLKRFFAQALTQKRRTMKFLHFGHRAECIAGLAELMRLGEQYLAGQLELGTQGVSDEEVQNHVKVLQWMSMSEYFAGNIEQCLRLSVVVAGYLNDPRFSEIIAPSEACIYRAVCQKKLGARSAGQIEEDLIGVLASGQCNEKAIAWIFRALARSAGDRNDKLAQYLTLRDALDCVYPPSLMWSSTAQLRHLEAEFPDLAQAPDDLRSPAYEAMEAAGLIISSTEDLNIAFARRGDAFIEGSGGGRVYFKPNRHSP